MKNMRNAFAAVGTTVVVLLSLTVQGCGKKPDQSLRERAEAWTTLLTNISGKDERDISKIEEFIEPSAAKRVKAEEYYNRISSRTHGAKVTTSVDDVAVDANGTSGRVRFVSVIEVGTESLQRFFEEAGKNKDDVLRELERIGDDEFMKPLKLHLKFNDTDAKQAVALLRNEPNAQPIRHVFSQETTWKLINGTWYRTIESEAEIRSKIK